MNTFIINKLLQHKNTSEARTQFDYVTPSEQS